MADVQTFPDDRLAWERWPKEPNLWFDRFTRFRRMGVKRSRLQVYRKEIASDQKKAKQEGQHIRLTKKNPKDLLSTPGKWDEYARAWQWDKRAELWDAHHYELTEKKLTDRKEKCQENSYKLYKKLLKRVEQMLEYPLTQVETVDDDGNFVTIHPVKWTARDIPSHIAALQALGSLSVYGIYNPKISKSGGYDGAIPVVSVGEAEVVGGQPKLLSPAEVQDLSDKDLINHVLEQVRPTD